MKLEENDKYYYDPIAAERPINFISRYLCHYEDPYTGQPFLLLDWQKKAARDIFGWLRRDTGQRRFREVYLEIAKGNGKSPFITALGMFLFAASGAHGLEIISVGGDYKQADITFSNAKKYIKHSAKLAGMFDVKQFEINNFETDSRWVIMSGTGDNKQGFRPSVLLGDEVHEWHDRRSYDSITSNLVKKPNPLILLATNSGENRDGICWELHQRAERTLSGNSKDETYYPILYSASPKDNWNDEATWAKANPSLGATITLDALRIEYVKAKENPALEARFRRLNLSQWVQNASRWLDMAQWDSATKPYKADLASLPCYLGVDLSVSDDLSTISAVWVGAKDLYVRVWTYVPGQSAAKYEERDSIPFGRWAQGKYVRLLDSQTVDAQAQQRIGRFVKKLRGKYTVKALTYDRFKANALIAQLEKDGLICIPVPQTFEGIGGGTAELERRLKAGTIRINDCPCLRWQAANVEVMADKYGNIRPVKEAQRGAYAGRRGSKIDGIVSIVTALSEVLRHEMRKLSVDEMLSQWDGKIQFV